MTEFLINLFIKDKSDVQSSEGRKRYGLLAGCVGIVANILLSAVKFIIGAISGSIAIQADAVNNLSDVGSAVVTIFGSKAASKPADGEHPYGHARIEYISALIIAFIILLVGFELGKEAIAKIIEPEPVDFSIPMLIVLMASILVKLWMSRFTANIGNRIDSKTMQAATKDSLCDVISTSSILLSSVIGYFFKLNLDGYIGVVVAGFVLYSGIGIIKDSIGPLLGEAPDPQLIKTVNGEIMAYDGIIGVHDILVHSYGPGRTIVSAHAEVRSDCDLISIHEVIDSAEHEIGKKLGLLLTLHLDPIETDNEVLNATKEKVEKVILGERLNYHDFRMVNGENHVNLVFDIVVSPGTTAKDIAAIKDKLNAEIKKIDPMYNCVIGVDYDYTSTL